MCKPIQTTVLPLPLELLTASLAATSAKSCNEQNLAQEEVILFLHKH